VDNSSLEFYRGEKLLASVASSLVPHVGGLVSIRGKTWKIVNVTYAVDHSDAVFSNRVMRANIDVEAPAASGEE